MTKTATNQGPDKAQTRKDIDIWHTLENLPSDGNFKIRVEREYPLECQGVDISGIVVEYVSPVSCQMVRDKVGGGKYKIQVWKDGLYHAGQRVTFPGAPKLEPGTIPETQTQQLRPQDARDHQDNGGYRYPPGPQYYGAQDKLLETLLEIKQELKNRDGNGASKQINPLDSLTSLSGFITTLVGALTGGPNDPKRLVDTMTNAFQQGLGVGQTSNDKGAPSAESAAITEAIKNAPEVMKSWHELELKKLEMLLKYGYQPVPKDATKLIKVNSSTQTEPAQPPPAETEDPKDKDPNRATKATMKKLARAAAANDDPYWWAGYLARFFGSKTTKTLVEGGVEKSVEFFVAIDPEFGETLKKYKEWFVRLFYELKEGMQETNGNSSPPGDDPGNT